MPSNTMIAARGKVIGIREGLVIFNPSGTNYELHLLAPRYSGPVGTLVQGAIHVTARKVWTVPSGGNFVAPIFGPPRIVQGRVRAVDEQSMTVQAGAPFLVDLPEDDSAFELASGAIGVGTLVNLTVEPGARFEWVKE